MGSALERYTYNFFYKENLYEYLARHEEPIYIDCYVNSINISKENYMVFTTFIDKDITCLIEQKGNPSFADSKKNILSGGLVKLLAYDHSDIDYYIVIDVKQVV